MTWRIDPPTRGRFDILHASGKTLMSDVPGKREATILADRFAERHNTEYVVFDRVNGGEVHRARPPERPREE